MFHEGDWHQMIKVEECREGRDMIVRAELPGVDPDKDIDVEIIENSLVISAEKNETHHRTENHYHRSEFRYGSLTRSIPIPSGVDRSSITASYSDGVLEVRMTLPVETMEGPSKRIEVKRA